MSACDCQSFTSLCSVNWSNKLSSIPVQEFFVQVWMKSKSTKSWEVLKTAESCISLAYDKVTSLATWGETSWWTWKIIAVVKTHLRHMHLEVSSPGKNGFESYLQNGLHLLQIVLGLPFFVHNSKIVRLWTELTYVECAFLLLVSSLSYTGRSQKKKGLNVQSRANQNRYVLLLNFEKDVIHYTSRGVMLKEERL